MLSVHAHVSRLCEDERDRGEGCAGRERVNYSYDSMLLCAWYQGSNTRHRLLVNLFQCGFKKNQLYFLSAIDLHTQLFHKQPLIFYILYPHLTVLPPILISSPTQT